MSWRSVWMSFTAPEDSRARRRAAAPCARALAVLSFAAGLPAAALPGEPVRAFVNVRVFDGGGSGLLENATVIVRGDRIVTVAAAAAGETAPIPEGAIVVEGRGRTLLPGLFDLHVHLGGPATRFDRPLRGDALLRAERVLACGVTSVLDLNAPDEFVFALRALERSGVRAGLPRIFAAGAAVTCPGGHGTEGGFPCRVAADPQAMERAIASLVPLEPDVVKFFVERGGWADVPSLPSLDEATLQAGIDAAHRAGMRAVVHATDLAGARLAVRLGADALAHVPLVPGAPDELAAFTRECAARRVPVITGLAVVEALFRAPEEGFLDRPLVATFTDARLLAGFAEPAWRARESQSARATWLRERFPALLETVRALYAAGVPLLAGTDAGNPATLHGEALHRELELLVAAGVPEADALRMATSAAAEFLGRGAELGRVAEGFVADLLLVDGNPARRISDTRNVALVLRGGLPVDRAFVARRVAERSLGGSAGVRGGTLLFDFESPAGALPLHVVHAGGRDENHAEALCVLDHGDGNATCFLRLRGTIDAPPAIPARIGVTLALAPAGGAVDLSSAAGLRFRVRADRPRALRFVLHQRGEPDADGHGASFAAGRDWETIDVPFARLEQAGFGRRRALSLRDATALTFASLQDERGPFRVDVDDVELIE